MAGAPKRTVLCFVVDPAEQRLLMIHKKTGQGAGRWNVPGGKVETGESEAEAAARECLEETGILPAELREAGRLEFYFPESEGAADAWDNTCAVFRAERFSGQLIAESDECTAEWIPLDRIPVEAMWDSDRLWLPLFLRGQPFHRIYTFDREEKVREERVLL